MIVAGNNAGAPAGVINLSKGAKINLTKQAPGLKKVLLGLSWSTQKYSGCQDFDLDASVFCQNDRGMTTPEGFVFYNNLIAYDGAVQHMGDERVGGKSGERGDDEQIIIDLTKVPENITKIAVCITIDSAIERRQSFGMVSDSVCRIVDAETDREVARFDLGEDFSAETAVVVGELYRFRGDWQFRAIGQGFNNGLIGLCNNYGLQAEYR